jgi:clan AA aspartic protease (TIGR02281 family)
MDRWLGRAIMTAALVSSVGYAAGSPPRAAPLLRLNPFDPGAYEHDANRRAVADPAGGCGPARLGETTVATPRNAPIVTLFANGTPVTLLLDTGAETTVLTPAAAGRVGAQRPVVEFQRQLHSLSGSLDTSEVELRSFTVGGVAIPWRRVRVAPVNVPGVFAGPLDGVIGADTLSSFDVDLDLPHYRMVLYQRQACSDAKPTWAEPYTRIAAGRSKGDHLFFPVQLEGRRIDAFVDTGAQLTVLSTRAAQGLGVREATLAHDRPLTTRGAASEQMSAHLHRFSQLEIGGEFVRNPEIMVADVRLSDADLVLGIDFLRSRRIWFSYASQQIFLSRRA